VSIAIPKKLGDRSPQLLELILTIANTAAIRLLLEIKEKENSILVKIQGIAFLQDDI